LARADTNSLVAGESRGAWSYATVWRVADRAGIPLTAGRETMGRRLSAEQRAAITRTEHSKSSRAPPASAG